MCIVSIESAGSTPSAKPDGGATPPVFLIDDKGALTGLTSGYFDLSGPESKHAQVQRIQVGESIDVVDGQGLRLKCKVENTSDFRFHLKVIDSVQEPAPAVKITLVQALAKSDRDELAITTAVEVGVDAVQPWQADRSIVIWRADKAEKAKAKWQDAVRSAAKQARRAWVPPVYPVVNSKLLAKQIASIVQDGGVAWVLDAAGTITVGDAMLPPSNSADDKELLIIVGPEGGISGSELQLFQDAGAQLVRLGPHIMRTSTAGPIAVSRAVERFGRWG